MTEKAACPNHRANDSLRDPHHQTAYGDPIEEKARQGRAVSIPTGDPVSQLEIGQNEDYRPQKKKQYVLEKTEQTINAPQMPSDKDTEPLSLLRPSDGQTKSSPPNAEDIVDDAQKESYDKRGKKQRKKRSS
jgi:hypothetical protein